MCVESCCVAGKSTMQLFLIEVLKTVQARISGIGANVKQKHACHTSRADTAFPASRPCRASSSVAATSALSLERCGQYAIVRCFILELSACRGYVNPTAGSLEAVAKNKAFSKPGRTSTREYLKSLMRQLVTSPLFLENTVFSLLSLIRPKEIDANESKGKAAVLLGGDRGASERPCKCNGTPNQMALDSPRYG